MWAMDPLPAFDGVPLHRHDWPIPPPARGLVCIVHGLGEHGQRYRATAQALNEAGWHVCSFDLRGHGLSGGARGATPSPGAMFEDLAMVLDALPAVPGPRVLLGHSMGGLIAARFVAEALAAQPASWSRTLDALVLSSPALDPGMNAAQKLLLMLLGPLLPDLALGNGLEPAWVSRDPAVVQAYVDDPLVHDRVTPRLVRMIVDGGVAAQAAAARWRMPTLLMWAGADRCVAPAGSAAFAAAAPEAVVESRCFPRLAHEILNEPERAEVLAHLLAWLERLPAAARPAVLQEETS